MWKYSERCIISTCLFLSVLMHPLASIENVIDSKVHFVFSKKISCLLYSVSESIFTWLYLFKVKLQVHINGIWMRVHNIKSYYHIISVDPEIYCCVSMSSIAGLVMRKSNICVNILTVWGQLTYFLCRKTIQFQGRIINSFLYWIDRFRWQSFPINVSKLTK